MGVGGAKRRFPVLVQLVTVDTAVTVETEMDTAVTVWIW